MCKGLFEILKKCYSYVFPATNHEMYVQKVTKQALTTFDETRKNLNNLESLPCE